MKNITLGQRLIGAYLIMAVIVVSIGLFGAVGIQRMSTGANQGLAARQRLVLLMGETEQECRGILLQAAVVSSGKEAFLKLVADYQNKRDMFNKQCELMLKGDDKRANAPAPSRGEIEQKAKVVLTAWNEFDAAANNVISQKEKSLDNAASVADGATAAKPLASAELAAFLETDFVAVNDKVKDALGALRAVVDKQDGDARNDVDAIRKAAPFIFLALVMAAIAVAIVFGSLTTRFLMGRIKQIADGLKRCSEGDLATRMEVDSTDEFGQLSGNFNQMVGKLGEMVVRVDRSTGELRAISTKVTDVSRLVSGAASVQGKGIRETSSAVVEISSSISQVGQNVDRLSLSASETSSSILEMAASIEEVAMNVETLVQSVEEVSTSIVEMGASVKQIDGNVQKLMEASTTTACSIAEMDTSIKQVESNALDTVAISSEVKKDAESGKKSVDATIVGINDIRRASRIASDAIETLYAKADDIGKILLVIDEVAEQTNLLALNAAIIAAQAGSYGKGFAVVADEIKELAERTSTSTREISLVVKGVQNETRKAVEAIEIAEKSIVKGEQLSQKSGEALNKIVIGVQKSTDRMDEISRAAVEQAKGSQMIRVAMEQVSDMVTLIARATTEQGKGSDMIMLAAERMKGLTGEVRRSTREQTKVGNFIAQSTESITTMIQQIKNATDEQRRSSEQIVHAVKDIEKSTEINISAARSLGESVAGLSRQTEVFQKELSGYKV